MNFKPESCRNESEVISKLIVTYLLPQLGYDPCTWHQEVKFGNIRLDFLTLVKPVIPFVSEKIKPPNIIIEAKHPKEKLKRYTRKLIRYLISLNARYGILTNGKELKIYERNSDDEIRLIFRCSGQELMDKTEDIRAILGRDILAEAGVSVKKDTHTDIENNMIRGDCAEKANVCSQSEDSAASDPLFQETARSDIEKEKAKNMRIIAIYHNKGGVGKTTVSVNLAAALSRKGKRVLLIDIDAQANTTFATGLIKFQFEEEDNIINKYVYHLINSGDFDFIPDLVRKSDGFSTPEIDVIPSHIDLIVHQDRLNKVVATRTRMTAKLNHAKNNYDIVIVDTPPSRDLYAEIPLIATDYLIIPSDLKPFANQGLNNVKSFVKEINESRKSFGRDPLIILGVLPSKISTNSQYLKYTFPRQKNVIPQRYRLPLLETIIYERTPLSACVSRTKKVGDTEVPDPKSIFSFCELESTPSAEQAAEDFEALAVEVLNKIQI